MSHLAEALTHDEELDNQIALCELDPLRYVEFAFPWGEEGTELENEAGPRAWQRERLEEIRDRLKAGSSTTAGVIQEAIQLATASGHDIGKSALVAWLVLWAISTKVDTRGVVTANTDTQLRTKTWPEVAKWHRLAINGHLFELTATRICSKDPEHRETWRIDIIPWSEHNTEAFAGLHNKGKRVILIFDEASAIHDEIWRVTEGVLFDENTEIIWAVFGNPTRQSGRFRDCFGKLRHRWSAKQIDARTVEGTNKAQIAKLVEDHGEDSDEVRVRVRGEFPLQAEYQLINQLHVAVARRREPFFDRHQPIVAGLDFARSGSCETVLAFRCGRDAKSLPWFTWKERDSVKLVGKVSAALEDLRGKGLRVHTIFADGGGLGGPIIDMMTHRGYPMHEVLNGSRATDERQFGNKGSECWARMRDAMETLAIPDDPVLEQQLVSRNYVWNPKTNQLTLVSKDKMISEGEESPDRADALALTYAEFIVPAVDIAAETQRHRTVNDLDDDSPWSRGN